MNIEAIIGFLWEPFFFLLAILILVPAIVLIFRFIEWVVEVLW